MAWRPNQYFITGELDNTQRNRVTGWMWFHGLEDAVTFDLAGEFHRDIRGTMISLVGDFSERKDVRGAEVYMRHFATHQTGKVGDITAGLPPRDYVSYPYIEWYSNQNGRVVLELDREQLDVVGSPIPFCESDPVSWVEQNRNMSEYLRRMKENPGLGLRPGKEQPDPSKPEDGTDTPDA